MASSKDDGSSASGHSLTFSTNDYQDQDMEVEEVEGARAAAAAVLGPKTAMTISWKLLSIEHWSEKQDKHENTQ